MLISKGKSVLDLCCYTGNLISTNTTAYFKIGGFSIYAAKGGAKEVIGALVEIQCRLIYFLKEWIWMKKP